MIQKFIMPDGSLKESSSREASERLVAAGGLRVPSSTVLADVQPDLQPMTPDQPADPNVSPVTVDMLLDMTINAQMSYLSKLADKDLQALQTHETRKGALDHIADELERRTARDGSG